MTATAAVPQPGTALVVADEYRWEVRRRPTYAETLAIGRAFADGHYVGVSGAIKEGSRFLPPTTPARWLEPQGDPYALIRDYLILEHDADPRHACRVALRLTAWRYRS